MAFVPSILRFYVLAGSFFSLRSPLQNNLVCSFSLLHISILLLLFLFFTATKLIVFDCWVNLFSSSLFCRVMYILMVVDYSHNSNILIFDYISDTV